MLKINNLWDNPLNKRGGKCLFFYHKIIISAEINVKNVIQKLGHNKLDPDSLNRKK